MVKKVRFVPWVKKTARVNREYLGWDPREALGLIKDFFFSLFSLSWVTFDFTVGRSSGHLRLLWSVGNYSGASHLLLTFSTRRYDLWVWWHDFWPRRYGPWTRWHNPWARRYCQWERCYDLLGTKVQPLCMMAMTSCIRVVQWCSTGSREQHTRVTRNYQKRAANLYIIPRQREDLRDYSHLPIHSE